MAVFAMARLLHQRSTGFFSSSSFILIRSVIPLSLPYCALGPTYTILVSFASSSWSRPPTLVSLLFFENAALISNTPHISQWKMRTYKFIVDKIFPFLHYSTVIVFLFTSIIWHVNMPFPLPLHKWHYSHLFFLAQTILPLVLNLCFRSTPRL